MAFRAFFKAANPDEKREARNHIIDDANVVMFKPRKSEKPENPAKPGCYVEFAHARSQSFDRPTFEELSKELSLGSTFLFGTLGEEPVLLNATRVENSHYETVDGKTIYHAQVHGANSTSHILKLELEIDETQKGRLEAIPYNGPAVKVF